jgi:hypothetical protein
MRTTLEGARESALGSATLRVQWKQEACVHQRVQSFGIVVTSPLCRVVVECGAGSAVTFIFCTPAPFDERVKQLHQSVLYDSCRSVRGDMCASRVGIRVQSKRGIEAGDDQQ